MHRNIDRAAGFDRIGKESYGKKPQELEVFWLRR
jgi:hypothetical protein